MTTYVLTGLVNSEDSARKICSLIEKIYPRPLGTGFFELDERNSTWEIEAYFQQKPKLGDIALLEGIYSTELRISAVEKVDWVSEVQRNLTPIAIGNIYIHGVHHRDKLDLNKKNIEIQAAMAFGTGHHATTRSCIDLYRYLLRKRWEFRNVLDIGSGTGVLSMVAVKTKKTVVTAIDNDLIAVETTRTNFSKNKISIRNLVLKSNELRNPLIFSRGKFDLIFANILFLPLKNMVKNVRRNLRAGGVIILSGMSHKQSILVEKVYANHNFRRVKIAKEGPWTSLALRYFRKNK
ncbi:MAG: hypothetical protein CML39_09465 [Rhodobacteraceae bacterium]|nr:MAG: hypothetical protein CML39_09465 [Paracoccaceae bacterium]